MTARVSNKITGANAGEPRRLPIRAHWAARIAQFCRSPHMMRLPILMPLCLLLTGCYTYVQAPGAVGKVVDAATGAPIRGAKITRPFIPGGLGGAVGVSSEGLEPTTVLSDKTGRFSLPPATHTQIALMNLHNPEAARGAFLVSADGYSTNQVEGSARSGTLRRAQLGEVPLRKR